MTSLVSILIPAFNSQEWLAETLQSAISQTWNRKEIIVVDDGSRDQTLDIANKFASGNVRVVTQDNQGAAAARNKALSLSQGDYIQWLDADDLLAPDKIAQQMARAEMADERRFLFSSAWGRFMYRQHKAEFVPTILWQDLTPKEWLLRKMEHNLYMQTATWLVSRELTEAAGPWNTALLGDDDGEYFCRVLMKSEGTRFVKEAKVYYRVLGANRLSHIGHSNRKLEAQFHSMKLHICYLRSIEESDRCHAACVRYLQNWLFHFYPERLDLVGEAEKLAVDLGGNLARPDLSWKYVWLKAIVGWGLAKRLQLTLPMVKLALERFIDRMILIVEKRMHVGHSSLGS